MIVETDVRDGIHVISMQDGKLNCMATPMRRGLLEAIDAVSADPDCRAVVLIGRGKAFSAGADINELNSVAPIVQPALHQMLFPAIEALSVPVIAALHGSALGGGLELALACSYRVAAPDAILGLPEINLGLFPGAGGTQRLPRAIGVEAALNLMLAGDTFPAAKAPEGLIDRIVEGELLQGALAFADEVADARPVPVLMKKSVAAPGGAGFFQFARGAAKADPRKLPGALPIIDMVEAATKLPPAKAIDLEFETFTTLMRSDASKPFRYAFLAERATSAIPGVDPKSARPVASAAVIGAGTMGAGIAITLSEAGIPVRILDLNAEALQRGLDYCRKTWDSRVAKGRMTDAKRDTLVANVQGVESYSEIGECDLVIEAVVEQMPVKKAVFAELDRVMKAGAVLATNTSALDLDEIAAVTGRAGDVIGLHFFSPANIMKLLEVVRGKNTAPDVLATALALAKKLRKIPVVSGVCEGFIGNRMIDRYVGQAMYLVEEGATPQQVDKALERWGMAMGPFRMGDVVGNDVPWEGRKRNREADADFVSPVIADEICERGWFGQKTGLGWYKYVPGQRKPLPNPDLVEVIEATSVRLGIERRKISDEEIVRRCIFALVNEAAAILDEGIAQRGSDIDIAYLYGYGFPRFRGGPLFFADQAGLYAIIRQIRKFAAQSHGEPDFWTPHPLLLSLCESGESLSQYEVTP